MRGSRCNVKFTDGSCVHFSGTAVVRSVKPYNLITFMEFCSYEYFDDNSRAFSWQKK